VTMAKKSKELPRWRVSLLKHPPVKVIGEVEAPDAETAIAKAAEMYRVREVDRFRLSARRVS
jgi:1,2-phenylacetyl-CoA epoxidase PaaB subunit